MILEFVCMVMMLKVVCFNWDKRARESRELEEK